MARPIRWGWVSCPKCRDKITNNALGREAHIRNCLSPDDRFRVFSVWTGWRNQESWTWERRDGLGVGQGYRSRTAAFKAAWEALERLPYVERYIP